MDAIVITLIIVLIVFLLVREFWAWYFKINRLVDLLEDANRALEKIEVVLSATKSDHRKGVQFITDEIRRASEYIPTGQD